MTIHPRPPAKPTSGYLITAFAFLLQTGVVYWLSRDLAETFLALGFTGLFLLVVLGYYRHKGGFWPALSAGSAIFGLIFSWLLYWLLSLPGWGSGNPTMMLVWLMISVFSTSYQNWAETKKRNSRAQAGVLPPQE